MCDDSDDLCLCPFDGVMNSISKKWALLIINMIGNHRSIRFNSLMNELSGISPRTLADTLKDLQREQLIERNAFPEIPPRVEYHLTKDGEALRESVIPLLKWAAKRDNRTIEKCISVCDRTTCPGKRLHADKKRDDKFPSLVIL